VDRFDEEADKVLRRLFANLREETVVLVRPPGALAARRSAERRYRDRLLAFAGVFALLLAGAGGGYALTGERAAPAPGGQPSASPTPSPRSGEGVPSLPPTGSSASSGGGAGASVGPADGPVPPGLRVESVTFIDVDSAWALGFAPCLVPQQWSTCPAVVRSRDGGKTWAGVPAPGHAAAYLGDIRFATDKDGWVVARAPVVPSDPGAVTGALYATHDGGSTWAKVGLTDPVLRVETSGGRVWVSTGTAGAARHAIYSASIHSDTFTKVTDASGAELALHGAYAYVYGTGTSLVVLRNGGTTTTRGLPCDPDHRSTVLLAVSADQSVAVLCGGAPSGGDQDKAVFTSTDGGATWAAAGTPDRAGQAASLAATTTDIFVAGVGMPVRARGADGTWAAVPLAPGPDGGFGFVGFTNDTHGVALAIQPSNGLAQTTDGGRTWTQRLPGSATGS